MVQRLVRYWKKKSKIDNGTNVRYNNSRFATWSYFYFTEPVNMYPDIGGGINYWNLKNILRMALMIR